MVSVMVSFKEYPVIKRKSKKKKTSKRKKKVKKNGKASKKNVALKKRNPFENAKKSYSVYTAQKDTTLWAIAKKKYKDGSKYKKIYEANRKKKEGFHQLKSVSETVKKGWKLKIPKR